MPRSLNKIRNHWKKSDFASSPAQCSQKHSSTPAPQPISTSLSPAFPRFSLLPQEIQNTIWQVAIDAIGPRVVVVREDIYLWERRYTSSCPIPDFLHLCRTSRELALKRWKLSFATNNDPGKIFFDFSLDTLFFDESFPRMSEFTDRVIADDLERITKVAFDLQQQLEKEYYLDGAHMSHNLKIDFPNLTHLIIPAEDYDFDWRYALDGLPQPELDPNKRVILLFDADADDVDWMEDDTEILRDFEEHRKAIRAEPINVVYVNYCRSLPDQIENKQREIIRSKYGENPSLTRDNCFCSEFN